MTLFANCLSISTERAGVSLLEVPALSVSVFQSININPVLTGGHSLKKNITGTLAHLCLFIDIFCYKCNCEIENRAIEIWQSEYCSVWILFCCSFWQNWYTATCSKTVAPCCPVGGTHALGQFLLYRHKQKMQHMTGPPDPLSHSELPTLSFS